jgi:hypothetical protein
VGEPVRLDAPGQWGEVIAFRPKIRASFFSKLPMALIYAFYIIVFTIGHELVSNSAPRFPRLTESRLPSVTVDISVVDMTVDIQHSLPFLCRYEWPQIEDRNIFGVNLVFMENVLRQYGLRDIVADDTLIGISKSVWQPL